MKIKTADFEKFLESLTPKMLESIREFFNNVEEDKPKIKPVVGCWNGGCFTAYTGSNMLQRGKSFENYTQALYDCEKEKAITRLRVAINQVNFDNDSWSVDWCDHHQQKHCIRADHETKQFGTTCVFTSQLLHDDFYFGNELDLKLIRKILGDDSEEVLNLYLGI